MTICWHESTISLNSGNKMPLIGLGTFQLKNEECTTIVCHALHYGYRLIDTARCYKNEKFVAAAIKISGIPREKIFITSKIAPNEQGEENSYEAVKNALLNLNSHWIDLVLIHWPGCAKVALSSIENKIKRISSWRGLMRAKKEGLVKDIGVSNFTIEHLNDLLSIEELESPAINQIEIHPFCIQEDIRQYCREKGIVCQAYSSFGQGSSDLLNHTDIVTISEKYEIQCSEVLLLWAVEQSIPVIPKTTSISHLNLNLLKSYQQNTLTNEDIKLISNLNRNHHFCWNPSTVR